MQTYEPVRGMHVCASGGSYVKREDHEQALAAANERNIALTVAVEDCESTIKALMRERDAANEQLAAERELRKVTMGSLRQAEARIDRLSRAVEREKKRADPATAPASPSKKVRSDGAV